MVAMKPRTGDGPLEVERSLHGTTLRIPLEGGGRLVLEMNEDEIQDLHAVLAGALNS